MFEKRLLAAFACAASLTVLSLVALAGSPAPTGVPVVWGYDGYGQLGDAPPLQRTTPQALAGVPTFVAAAGSYHVLALAEDGTCWAWGLNAYGQLGDGTLTSRSTPAPMATLQGLVSVAAGTNHSVLLKSDGTVWACGVGGTVGDGTTVDRHSPVQVVGLGGVVAVSAMGNFTLALKADGTVWAWGSNNYGQLGDGTTTLRPSPVQVSSLQNVVAISAGYQHAMAVDANGTVWAWGRNSRGQLGDGTNVNRPFPVQVVGLSGVTRVSAGAVFSLAMKVDGTVWAWGHGGLGELGNGAYANSWTPVQVAGLTGTIHISTGYYHALAATDSGAVYAWGSETYGECAQGTMQRFNTPQAVAGVNGSRFVAAYYSWSMCGGGSTAWTWGMNDTGRLGDGRTLYRYRPTVLGPASNVVSLAGGEFHGLALVDDGTVGGWGYNEYGQLGIGTLSFVEPPQFLPGFSDVAALAAGPDHSLALKADGTVWAWGDNSRGELGNDYMDYSATPAQVAGLSGITAVQGGWDFSLALKNDGTVWAWGANDQGQLGDGSGVDQTTPVQVSGITSAVGIAAENYANHCLAVLADGTVRAWGTNGAGQLGDGTTTPRPTPVAVTGLSGVVGVAAGAWGYSVAVKYDGTVWAWGANNRGELGDGTTTPSLVPIQVPGLSGITAISAGDTHTLALKSDGTVWAWGVNWFGHTGQSSTEDQLSPLPVPGITGAIGVAAGGDFSMALVTCALTCSATVPEKALQNAYVPFSSTASPGLGCLVGEVSYDWDFGDGSPHSNQQNTYHAYAAGAYTWTLTASAEGSNCIQSGTVTVCPLACAGAASPPSGVVPLSVSFTGTASVCGVAVQAGYLWDFGDGSTSTEQNPTHLYTQRSQYDWTMTATLEGQTSMTSGTVQVNACTLTCSASVDRATGDTGTAFNFSSTVLHPDCAGIPAVDWDFGDGSPHGSGAGASHTYAQPGTYTWTMRASLGGGQCAAIGQVFVTVPIPSAVQGSVGIRSGGSFWPLNTDSGTGGISDLQVYAVAQGSGTHIPATTLTGSAFSFTGLTPGTAYSLYAAFDYTDHITQGNDDLAGYGCAAPGTVAKHAVSQGAAVTPAQGTTTFADVAIPPPLVMLHGLLECYTRWTSSDPGDTAHWDNAARAAGFLSFTPNYTWWLPTGSWGQSSDQILAQVRADLAGLVGTPPGSLEAGAPAPATWPPYAVVAYDMGGLMVRVLTSGPHRSDAAVRAMGAAFLVGVPNSGTDVALGGGPQDILNTQVIVQSFNEIYPDFGDKTPVVFAMAGDTGWWGLHNSDGVVSLPSAFTIQRQACADNGSGTIVCQNYAYLTLNSAPADQHVFHHDHNGLASPSSTADMLTGVILPAVRANLSALRDQPAPTRGTPEAPGSTAIWGSTIRTVGQASGTVHRLARAGETTATSYPFYISATDGMAVAAFVSQGSATMAVVDANGNTVASRTGVTGTYTYTQVSPPSSTQSTPWRLMVTPEGGGATFQATFFEDGLFGTNGYATQHTYQPGASVTLRVDLEGILTGLSVGSVTATVPWSGSPITLSPAGATAYAATVSAPGAGGTYAVLFQTTGTYQGAAFTRWNYDAIDVLSPTRLFSGSFSDSAVDRSGDGLMDAIRFTAPVVYAPGGYLMVSGDLADSTGGFVGHASSTGQVAPGPQPTPFVLTFDLGGVHCDQFGAPFQVKGLQVVDGATLRPLDSWSGAVPTTAYASTGFQCLQGSSQPVVTSVQPGQGALGQVLTLMIGGHGFRTGATVALGTGVTVNGAQRVDDTLLTASLTIQPGAPVGGRDLVVTNSDGTTVTVADAFEVFQDQPPTAAIQSVTGLLAGDVLPPSPGPVMVSATATDDRRVASVEFLMDDGSGNFSVKATVTSFPYRWSFDPATVTRGAHAIKARAHDDAGQTGDSPTVTVYASPPTVTAVTGGGSPWQLKIVGTNFLSGLTVIIGDDGSPWSNAVFKSSTKVVVKGGKTLKARFPSGQAVAIRIQNPDGTRVTTTYTRP